MLNRPLSRWLKLVIILGILIPILIFVGYTDFQLVRIELSKIGFNFFILLVSTFIAYVLGTLGWWVCLGNERHAIKIRQLFAIRQVGETVGLYNPASVVGGDLLKAKLLSSHGVTRRKATESVAVSRLSAMISQVVLLIISAIWLLIRQGEKIATVTTIALVILITLLLAVSLITIRLLNKKTTSEKLQNPNNTTLFQNLQTRIRKLLGQCQQFYQQQNRAFWMSFGLYFLHWIAGSMEFYLIMHFTGYDITLMHGVLMDMGVVIIKSIAGFIPGQIGIEELANQLVLLAVGIGTGSLWITVSVLRRARQLCWLALSALLYLTIPKKIKTNVSINGNSIC